MAVGEGPGGAGGVELGHGDDRVRAFFDGLVAAVAVEVGRRVAGSTALMRISGRALATVW